MSECDRIADLVERVMTGDPWHGSNLETLLADVTPDRAALKPVPSAHSIWELVLHMTGWADEVRRRLGGAAAGEPAAGDWPAPPAPSAAAWDRDRQRLFAVHTELAAAIRAADPTSLDTPVLDERDRAAGVGMSRYLTLHGLVHHTVYHSGQIAQVRRALDGKS
jgi:hypothetical protein